ncbi:MAG: hypothetical protein NZV14_13815 [Bryobacteraceae bacterium]|nr:hypothetical protein [Bryobacteraceae bacterium]MDW8379236.1 hypothetical protein [Bryobacterales bacterium]
MYVYTANAYALGGFLRRPFQQVINVPAASSLSWVGGFQSSESGPFQLNGILSFQRAYTQVSGSVDNRGAVPVYNAQATAVLEDFRLQEVVSAKRVVAQLSTKIRTDNRNPVPSSEHEFSFSGTHFEELRINGQAIDADLNLDFWKDCPTQSALRQRYHDDPSARSELNAICGWKDHLKNCPLLDRADPEWTRKFSDEEIPERGGAIAATLLKHPIHVRGGYTEGFAIRIPDFGKIYLAEIIVENRSRRLNMLRFELGSPNEGEFAAGGVAGNGTWYP